MAMYAFPATLEGDAGSGFSVYFPDTPGRTFAGDSANETALGAREALSLHLDGMTAEESPLPSPSDLSQISPEPDAPEAARLLVTAHIPDAAASGDRRSHA